MGKSVGSPSNEMEADVCVVCNFMEEKPDVPSSWYPTQLSRSGWWTLVSIAGSGVDWYPNRLSLDRIHEVEEKLSDSQWHRYKWELGSILAPESHVPSVRDLIRASAPEKIKALAATLRFNEERGENK